MSRNVQKLREEFDRAFQQPRESATADGEGLLFVRVRESSLALRLSELGGVHQCPAVTRVPARYPAQLGLVGIRSTLVTAYSFAALVTHERTPHPGDWIAISARDKSIGFVFDEIEAYVDVPIDSIAGRDDGDCRRHSSGTVRTGETVRPVIDLAAVVETIRVRVTESKSKVE